MAALTSIDAKMRTEVGPELVPDFDPLSAQLAKMNRLLRAQLASRPGGAPQGDGTVGESAAGTLGTVGSIKSRQDAIRALEAVADFFKRRSRRVRFRCWWTARNGLWRRTFSKCWPTSRPMRSACACGGRAEGRRLSVRSA